MVQPNGLHECSEIKKHRGRQRYTMLNMLVYILLSPSNSTYHTIFWLWYVYYFLSLYKFVIYANIYIDIGTTLQVKLKY